MDDPMLVPRLAAEVKSHAIPDGCADCDAYTPERGCICPSEQATIDPDIITAMQHNINLLTDNLVQLSFRLTELEEKGKMRAHLDRDLLICALVKADLAIDYIPARPRTRTNIEAAMIAADVVMKMLDQERNSAQDRR